MLGLGKSGALLEYVQSPVVLILSFNNACIFFYEYFPFYMIIDYLCIKK